MAKVSISMGAMVTSGGHQLRISPSLAPAVTIPQRYAAVTPAPYLVADGTAEAWPLLAAISKSYVKVGP